MTNKKHPFFLTLFLILVVGVNLLNAGAVRADGETPTEPPAPTQVETEPTQAVTEVPTELPGETTSIPVESTPIPEEPTATLIPEILTQVPENIEVVVLNEEGDPVPLVSEEAAEIVEVVDPMWCPEGVLPGGPGCTKNFTSIASLINNMESTPGLFAQNGVIYFTSDPGSGKFHLDPTTLTGGAFETLNDFNLTLQGGWNGDIVAPAFSGQSNFGTQTIVIGTSVNPWVGNITLNDITLTNATQTSITIYTDGGDITLNNVDVHDQRGGNNTANLSSSSGDITVTNGTFDGNGTNSSGFSATTATGEITISDSSFTESRVGTGTRDGATLSATTVTLTNVYAASNDGDGITINDATMVILNNVVALNNGTNPPGNVPNDGSGVVVNGTAGTNVFINGGSFSFNMEYGIEVGDPANTTIYVGTSPTCTGNVYGCSNTIFVSDGTAPVITPNVSGTLGSGGWYTSNVTVSWSVSDAESGVSSSTGCTVSNLTSDTAGTTLTCSATNNAGLSNSVSMTVKIDQTAPVLSLPADITVTASGSSGAVVNYVASATDAMDASVPAVCMPASGSTFRAGTTTVNCSATDDAGNTSSDNFLVTVTASPATATNTPPSTPTTPAATQTSPSPTSVPGSSTSASNTSAAIIPVTGGLIDLNCDSVFSAFEIRLSFLNLCDQQAKIEGITTDTLPGALPNGFTFVSGVDVRVFSNGDMLPDLPDGAGIQMDFPASGDEQFAALHWNGNTWVEITQKTSEDNISSLMNANPANELYQLESADGNLYKVLTTERTGTFVLVKK